MLVTDLELTPWCPVHVVPLQVRGWVTTGQPQLRYEEQKGVWFLDLNGMQCPKAVVQSDCITQWIADVHVTEISPENARARMETRPRQ